MAHTFENTGFETTDASVLDVNGEGATSQYWTVATNGGAASVALWSDSSSVAQPVERFELDWTGIDTDPEDGTFLEEYNDPGTQLSAATFNASIEPKEHESFDSGWSSNESFFYSISPTEVAAFGGEHADTHSVYPRGCKIFGGYLLLVNSDKDGSANAGITVYRVIGSGAIVFFREVRLGADEWLLDVVSAEVDGVTRFFTFGQDTSGSGQCVVREFFIEEGRFSDPSDMGPANGDPKAIVAAGSSIYYMLRDGAGSDTNVIFRAELSDFRTSVASLDTGATSESHLMLAYDEDHIIFTSFDDISIRSLPSLVEIDSLSVGGGFDQLSAMIVGGSYIWTVGDLNVLSRLTFDGSNLAIDDTTSIASQFNFAIGIVYSESGSRLMVIGESGGQMRACQYNVGTLTAGSPVAYGNAGDNDDLKQSSSPEDRMQLFAAVHELTDTIFLVDPQFDTGAGGRLFHAYPGPLIAEESPPVSAGDDFDSFESLWRNSGAETWLDTLGSFTTLAAYFDSGTNAFDAFNWITLLANAGAVTLDAAEFDGAENFEDFEEVDPTFVRVVVGLTITVGDYVVTLDSPGSQAVSLRYTAGGGDTFGTVRDGLRALADATNLPLATADVGLNGFSLARDPLKVGDPEPLMVVTVTGPAPDSIALSDTDRAAYWSQTGLLRTL